MMDYGSTNNNQVAGQASNNRDKDPLTQSAQQSQPQHRLQGSQQLSQNAFNNSNMTPLVFEHEYNYDDEEQQDSSSKQQSKATIFSGTINLSNTIIGAGMLGLPGAFGGTGYIGGLVFIVTSAAFSAHGLVLLSKAAIKAGLPSSFYSVAHAAVPSYTILIDLAVTLKCFGVATGYLITISDCMVDALDHLLPTNSESFIIHTILSRRFWVVGATIAVLPVSFYKTLDELKRASALALIFVFLLAFGIIAYANGFVGFTDPCPDDASENGCKGDVVPFTDLPSTISKLPIFIFAFTCHQNIFPIVNELQNRTQQRLNKIINFSIGFALVLFSIVAIEGYRTYGSNVKGDILLNYPQNANVTVLRICIAFMLSLHYPLQLDPSRRCITSLVKVVRRWKQQRVLLHRHSSVMVDGGDYTMEEDEALSFEGGERKHHFDDQLFLWITISFLGLSFAVAMVVDDLGIVLACVGATGSTLVSYVLPGLIYMKLQPEFDVAKGFAILQLVVGCLLMPIALYFVIKKGGGGH